MQAWLRSDQATEHARVDEDSEDDAPSSEVSASTRASEESSLARDIPVDEPVGAQPRREPSEPRPSFDSLGEGLAEDMMSAALGGSPDDDDGDEAENFGMHTIQGIEPEDEDEPPENIDSALRRVRRDSN